MYLIRTRFAGATDHRGARYIVTSIGAAALPDGRKRLTVPFDYGAPDAAKAAAEAFARAVSHGKQWVEYMGTENGDTYWVVTF